MRWPDKAAIISTNSQRSLSYGELNNHAKRIAASLSHLSTNSRVMVIMDDKLLTAASVIGIHYAGHVFIPVDARKFATIDPLIKTVQPNAILTEAGAIDAPELDRIKSVYGGVELIDGNNAIQSDLVDGGDVFMPALNDLAVMLFTSGTTSARKAVCLSHRAFAAPIYSINPAMEYTHDAIEYVCGNLDHAFALGRFRTALPFGATLVVDEGPLMPQKILTSLAATGANVLSSPAAGILLLLHKHEADFATLHTQLAIIKMASQAVSVAAKRKLVALFPDTRIYLNYGLSEAQRTTLIALHNDPDHLHSSGKPVAGHRVIIRDPETHDEVAVGQVGLISVLGPNVMDQYWNNPEKTTAAFKDGWLVTDDLGYLTDTGYLVVQGRYDETINSGGEKYSPDEIENVLRPHMGEIGFAICAMDDPMGILGEVPVLCVETGDSESPEKWKSWPALRIALLKQKIGSIPKQAFSFKMLPRTTTGKIQRKKLTALCNELVGQIQK
ncbi:rfbL protein [Amylibacter ulvae]|uniref:RfbL protein n=1 Tax=Paramylibacter ulvae TaxID=1651968 RepID=A0ABQ3CYJ3_9RHOB|nr:class I adenylate-forming enzyme family protein [Amylibacter ulvae]GHA49408.1 rfbL protein [Amylibacter ulvae]